MYGKQWVLTIVLTKIALVLFINKRPVTLLVQIFSGRKMSEVLIYVQKLTKKISVVCVLLPNYFSERESAQNRYRDAFLKWDSRCDFGF